jgi:hypothetical protein
MTCQLSLTMHNMMPEKPSEGIHVPFHTIVMDPLRRPFTFGPKMCNVKNGSHIGLESDTSVAASFVGTDGEFLVMSPNQFAILTPKQGIPITVGHALFPKDASHELHVAEKDRSYPIAVGACILAYNFNETPSLKSITIFMGSDSRSSSAVYHSALGAMAQSLVYFNTMWKTIAQGQTIVKEAFQPMEVSREKFPDMRMPMGMAPYKPPLTLVVKPGSGILKRKKMG